MRPGVIRAVVVVCVTLAALGVLVPAEAPALSPMAVTITTWHTQTYPTFGPQNFTLTFTFSNVTTTMTSTSFNATTTIYIPSFTTYIVNTTIFSSLTKSTTVASTTKTVGTTTVPSTTTGWTTVTGTKTNRTVTATVSEATTTTMTFSTSTVITSTSIYTVTGANPPTPPPIPGFPLESILAGLGLGLLGVHLVFRNRRANRKRTS